MQILSKVKDGGPDSTVTAFILIEIKCLFSIMLLKFDGPSRNVYHTHAFNSISWLLWGKLFETFPPYTVLDNAPRVYKPSIKPIWTPRLTFHKVDSVGISWVLTFRGPWDKYWFEYDPKANQTKSLTHGRVEV